LTQNRLNPELGLVLVLKKIEVLIRSKSQVDPRLNMDQKLVDLLKKFMAGTRLF
jgi:hypothetical protein